MRPVPIASLGEPRFPSPLALADAPGRGVGRFVPEGVVVRHLVEVPTERPDEDDLAFEKAGPRARLFFDPGQVRAAVVTCGGLCPGLNNVIRSLFLELHYNYGVREVLGVRQGYQGLNPAVGPPPVPLNREFVRHINTQGGTALASSRGSQDVGTMVDTLQSWGVNALFCVGGDGTQRGAHAIHEEAARRGYPLAVVGLPKTIDNDLRYCTRTFGVATAIEKAREVVHWAHVEATSVARGVGLVKLMGRDSGFIACGAAMASQEVNFVLIPEQPFCLDGERGLLAALGRRMDARGHAVIVVAEGAGQDLCGAGDLGRDASGNRRYHDVGLFLRDAIAAHFRAIGRPVELKYIDPSYIIRSVPANSEDAMLCDELARRAVDAALAGKSDLLVCALNSAVVHVPIPMAVAEKRKVQLEGRLWSAVRSTTGQPASFGP